MLPLEKGVFSRRSRSDRPHYYVTTRYHAHTRWTTTFDLDLWPWL